MISKQQWQVDEDWENVNLMTRLIKKWERDRMIEIDFVCVANGINDDEPHTIDVRFVSHCSHSLMLLHLHNCTLFCSFIAIAWWHMPCGVSFSQFHHRRDYCFSAVYLVRFDHPPRNFMTVNHEWSRRKNIDNLNLFSRREVKSSTAQQKWGREIEMYAKMARSTPLWVIFFVKRYRKNAKKKFANFTFSGWAWMSERSNNKKNIFICMFCQMRQAS